MGKQNFFICSFYGQMLSLIWMMRLTILGWPNLVLDCVFGRSFMLSIFLGSFMIKEQNTDWAYGAEQGSIGCQTRDHMAPNKGAYGVNQGSIPCQTREHTVLNKGAYGAKQGSIRCRMFPREHTVQNKGAYGAKQGIIWCRMFPREQTVLYNL